ncbi:rhodanese-like domain-containing protein [Clostridium manihotivorum]|uniref:Rhodanese-like domain-containing protein n=1 Tax=Clostridium manihotivorum TaxID=2320868 RepID=A0A410DNL6_9CLOT|nr:rhodanese-like domain-containing protein [Clostridium manihotivorum]QAA30658.1 rhodanese-like domain-containing protein [Clostridium manihotivorum]
MNQINITDAKKLLADNDGILILDVRTDEEFEEGHIDGAVLIPANKLPFRYEEILDYEDKPVLVYCQTGGRSPMATNFLEENGFSDIYHLYEGFARWK